MTDEKKLHAFHKLMELSDYKYKKTDVTLRIMAHPNNSRNQIWAQIHSLTVYSRESYIFLIELLHHNSDVLRSFIM